MYALYRDRLTLEKIGNLDGVTRERVRQLIAKSIRKLSHPTRLCYIKVGVKGMIANAKQVTEEKRKAKPVVSSQIAIEELDFSVRTYNCLCRAGINTLEDISKLTLDKLQHIRNLGRRSYDEVIAKLSEYDLSLAE